MNEAEKLRQEERKMILRSLLSYERRKLERFQEDVAHYSKRARETAVKIMSVRAQLGE